MSSFNNDDDEPEAAEEEASFKVLINPSRLMYLNLVWQLVLEAETPEVIPKAVSFLIKCFMSLTDNMADERAGIC